MGRSRGAACIRGRDSGRRRHARCAWWVAKLTWHAESGGGRALACRHVWRNWILTGTTPSYPSTPSYCHAVSWGFLNLRSVGPYVRKQRLESSVHLD